jgi:hypothetical protein
MPSQSGFAGMTRQIMPEQNFPVRQILALKPENLTVPGFIG